MNRLKFRVFQSAGCQARWILQAIIFGLAIENSHKRRMYDHFFQLQKLRSEQYDQMRCCSIRNRRRLDWFSIKIKCRKRRSSIMIDFELCLVSNCRNFDRSELWKPINRWYTVIESSSTHCAYIALLPTLAHHTSSFQHKIYFQYLNSRLPTSRFLCTNYCESELTLDVVCVEMILKKVMKSVWRHHWCFLVISMRIML